GHGLIGAAVVKDHDVDDWVFHTCVMKADFATEQRDDLDLHAQVIDMGIRNLSRGLKAMDREVVGLELKFREIPAERFQLDVSTGDLLQVSDQLQADSVGEAVA